MKKVNVKNIDVFENMRKGLIKKKENFDYVTSGNLHKIIYKDNEFVKMDTDSFAGKGHHITTMFRKGLEEMLIKDKNSIKPNTKPYKEQAFCLGHIESVIGKPMVMLDINNCYWQTAYKLGYMSNDTYVAGRRKNAWKIGRNAAIGGLCKRQYITPYVNGRPVPALRRVISPKKEFQWVRNHIISYVYEKFFSFYENVLRRDFYMFLTDAVVTTPEMARQIKKLLWLDGYLCSEKTIEFTAVDREKRYVRWFDFTEPIEEVRDGKVFIVGYGREKYYQYALHQVLPDLLEEVEVSVEQEMINEDSSSDSGSFCSPECSLHYAQTGEVNDCCVVKKLVDVKNKNTVSFSFLPKKIALMFNNYMFGDMSITKEKLEKALSKYAKKGVVVKVPKRHSKQYIKSYYRLVSEIC